MSEEPQKFQPGHSFNMEGDPHNPIPENLLPANCEYQELFRIEKSENQNTVRYYAFFNKDAPDKLVDIGVLWYRYEGFQHQPIKWIEQKFAYGIRIEEKTENAIKFHVASLNYVHVTVLYQDGKFIAKTILNEKEAILSTIFVDVTTVILIKPNVHSVTVKGTTVDTNEEIQQIFYP